VGVSVRRRSLRRVALGLGHVAVRLRHFREGVDQHGLVSGLVGVLPDRRRLERALGAVRKIRFPQVRPQDQACGG
jgi:hypothetical protein